MSLALLSLATSAPVNHLSWLEAGVIGALQGVTELFPVSSLGHSVLLPAVIGGQWKRDMNVAAPESPYLAFIVGTHVATALALLIYFWRDWVRLIKAFFTSIGHRKITNTDEKLIWMLIIATIPVGLVGLLFEHWLRTNLGRPIPTACFLAVNGIVLIAIEQICRRRGEALDSEFVDERTTGEATDKHLAQMSVAKATVVGASQILALGPGISRSGITTAAGLFAGLRRADAARFGFLLATPVIFAAGVLKLGDLFGPLGQGIRAQALFGALLSGIGAYLSVRFLTRYFAKQSLRPFGVYCLVAGIACLVLFLARG